MSKSKSELKEIIKGAAARAQIIKEAASILKGYPELLAAEPKLAEFVEILEQSSLNRT